MAVADFASLCFSGTVTKHRTFYERVFYVSVLKDTKRAVRGRRVSEHANGYALLACALKDARMHAFLILYEVHSESP